MKKLTLLLITLLAISCNTEKAQQKVEEFRLSQSKTTIDNLIDAWHVAAAEANFDAYFSKMTDDAIYIGTDPTENWKYDEFKEFSKPYFDKGKAWSFTPLQRNVFISEYGEIAWFDELLDTQMELCRGSGVVKKQADGSWKIAHYVLSIAIPNDNVIEIIEMKQQYDSIVKSKL